MKNFIHAFSQILEGMEQGLSHYKAVDHEHFEDSSTGLKFHLYHDKPFEITHNGQMVAMQDDFSKEELELLGKMKHYLMISVANNRRDYLYELLGIEEYEAYPSHEQVAQPQTKHPSQPHTHQNHTSKMTHSRHNKNA